MPTPGCSSSALQRTGEGEGWGAMGRNTFRSLPWSGLVMGNHRTSYLQHLGAVVLFLCPYLTYALLAPLLSENCSSAGKGGTEPGAPWSLIRD